MRDRTRRPVEKYKKAAKDREEEPEGVAVTM